MWNVLAQLDGVIMTTSGYSGGKEAAPTYQTVSAGKTGHAEALQVVYDPSKVTYEQLLDVFWHQINPTQVRWSILSVTHALLMTKWALCASGNRTCSRSTCSTHGT